MVDLLIKHGYLVTVDSKHRTFRGDIAIDGSRITAVEKEIKGPADEIIDARGNIVLPGLVNAHTHLAMTLLRGFADDMALKPWLETKIWPMEKGLTEERVYLGSLLGCLEMIRSGTTCFADMYFFMEKVAQAVKESGLRGVLSYGIIERGDPELRKKEIKKAVELVKRCEGAADGRVLTMFGPHSPYTCSKDCLMEVKELARRYRVGIHIHLAESDADVRDTISFQGERPVKFLNRIGFLGPEVLAAHCVKVTDEEIGILKKNDVKIAHNPISNLKLASGLAPVTEYLKQGITVGLGTDGCASNNNLDLFEEMKACSLLQKLGTSDPTAVGAEASLQMATAGGAAALGLRKEIGSLEVGKKADLILINLKHPRLTPNHNPISNLVYSAHGDDVKTTIVNGEILMRDGKVLTLDETSIIERAQELAQELVSEVGKR